MKVRLLFIAGIVVAAVGLFVWSSQTSNISGEELRSLGVIVFPDAKQTPELALISHQGQPFTKESLHEKWSFAFFGYTHCPDICPITIAQLVQAENQLAKNGEQDVLGNIRPVFVSIDSKRDGYQKVADFIDNASDRFIGVTGDATEIKAFATFTGIGYKRMGKMSTNLDDDYLIEHQGYIAIFNPEGNLFGYIKPPFEIDHLARIFRGLAKSDGQII